MNGAWWALLIFWGLAVVVFLVFFSGAKKASYTDYDDPVNWEKREVDDVRD